MIDSADKVAKAIDKLGATLSEQLKQIAAEQRRTNELLKTIRKALADDYDDSGSEFPS